MTALTDARTFAVASMQAMASGTHADLVRVIHPEAVNREAGDEPPAASTPGPDGFWATALWLRSAFSELAFEVHEVVASGDLVAIHNTMSGRQTGDMVTYADGTVRSVMPATGRRFATTQTHWFRMRDGQVVEHWANRDDFGTAQQLGWVPPTPRFLLRAWRAKRRLRG
ncbi:MAG TPA: ester cyclase [Mycobacteriales bacterium]|nr:ester cyclase [Mycobacteriales bacterium]